MIDFSTLQGVTIPEGAVTQIESGGVVLWKLETSKPIVLEVEKITSDTYAGETTYTGEQFILLDIYPKTNSTVKVTYGGLTKAITDASGAAEPNAQQVFFGTFNGVADSVETPESGTLTIEGDCYAFGCGGYSSSSKSTSSVCCCVTAIQGFGNTTTIPEKAFSNSFSGCSLTTVDIPSGIKNIGRNAFQACKELERVSIAASVETIGLAAFASCSGLINVTVLATTPPILTQNVSSDGVVSTGNQFNATTCDITVPVGCSELYKAADGWSEYADRIKEG